MLSDKHVRSQMKSKWFLQALRDLSSFGSRSQSSLNGSCHAVCLKRVKVLKRLLRLPPEEAELAAQESAARRVFLGTFLIFPVAGWNAPGLKNLYAKINKKKHTIMIFPNNAAILGVFCYPPPWAAFRLWNVTFEILPLHFLSIPSPKWWYKRLGC